jgi:xylulokinase
MSRAPLVLGVDSSTQSTKVEARELQTGHLVASGRASHPATTPPVSEQDPEAWWSALRNAIEQLGDHRRDVVAISVAGQQHGLVLLDQRGQVVRPAKLWNDTTSAPNADRMVSELGAEAWARACGSVPVASFTISKLSWMAEHEPDALARTAKVMLPHDYLTWRLCNAHVTDRGDASGSGWFDPTANKTRPELLASAIGNAAFSAELPRVLGPHDVAGEISVEAAKTLGLPPGVLVGPGTGDNMGAALGLGLLPGDVALSLGTSGTVFAASSAPAYDPSGAVAGFADASGAFLPLVCTLNATKVTDTVAGWLGVDSAALSSLALDAPVGVQSAMLLPYFDGERTPNRPDATGVFFGLTNSSTRPQLARAAFDGVICGLLEGLDAIGRVTGAASTGRLVITGGGARSAAYRQRVADLADRVAVVPDVDEAVARGAAVQAAMAHSQRSAGEVTGRWSNEASAGLATSPRPGANSDDVRATYRDFVQS